MNITYECALDDPAELRSLYQHYGWWKDRSCEDIRTAVNNSEEFIAARETETDQLVASARVLTDYVYTGKILDLIVHESYRRHGLGTEVMEALLDRPSLQNVATLTVNCREGLVPFYEKFGFEIHEMTTELPDGTEEGYYLMVCKNG